MTVLVFGHSGQVATELRQQGNVQSLSRADADLSDPAHCAEVIHKHAPEIVINAAAFTNVDAAETQEELATVINGLAPTSMAKACRDLNIPFLHISTDYVFDGAPGKPWQTNDPTRPLGAYGRSKLIGEQGIRDAGGHHVILRTSWVFSAHGNNFVKTMLRLSETHEGLNVVADQIGGPTSASDIAAALLTISSLIRAGNKCSGLYHFAGAPETNWADFAREIFDQSRKSIKVTSIPASQYPTPAKRPANSVMDCGSLQRDFGIAQPDWKSGLTAVLKELDHV